MANWAGPPADYPAALKDVARTFTESDVSLTHDATEVANGSVRFPDTPTDCGSGTDAGSTNGARGLAFTPEGDLLGVRVSTYTDAVTHVWVEDTDQNLIAETSISGGSGVISASLSSGTQYLLKGDAGGASYTVYEGSSSFPIDGPTVTVDAGLGTYGNPDTAEPVRNFSAVTGLISSGGVTVEWPAPADVYAWDLAQLQRSVDGETVDVFVEADDGSGWTEIAGPIARGAPIDADADSNVRFRVEIARSNRNNDPTLDMVARRFKL